MGIPSYFSYIVKNHASIIQKYEANLKIINNLYLDCNSIIYDVYHNCDIDQTNKQFAVIIIERVILKIEEYIALIRPQNTIVIAFDGVAPVAKLEQQRSRRYKSWYQTELSANILKKENKNAWNTASITPGTKFMAELNHTVSSHFTSKSKQTDLQIIVSDSSQIGEGEHKIFAFIRDQNDKHLKEYTVIYGLDADLILLSINHLPVCPNIFLFRETPHFIQSIDSSLEPNANYLLDIPKLASNIVSYMSNEKMLNDPLLKKISETNAKKKLVEYFERINANHDVELTAIEIECLTKTMPAVLKVALYDLVVTTYFSSAIDIALFKLPIVEIIDDLIDF
jgi:hypothetical protein